MSEALVELFSSRLRAAVLAHLLPRPHLGFGLTDLSRLLGLPISSLQHECYKLVRIGVLKGARDGAARRYRPNPAFPLLGPLTALVVRDLGPALALPAAAGGVDGIDLAFLAGAVGPGDVATLLVVGTLEVEGLDALHARVADVLAALSAPAPELAFFPPSAWRTRLETGAPFVRALVEAPRIPIVADGPESLRGPGEA